MILYIIINDAIVIIIDIIVVSFFLFILYAFMN